MLYSFSVQYGFGRSAYPFSSADIHNSLAGNTIFIIFSVYIMVKNIKKYFIGKS
jgi:hypothetical protein